MLRRLLMVAFVVTLACACMGTGQMTVAAGNATENVEPRAADAEREGVQAIEGSMTDEMGKIVDAALADAARRTAAARSTLKVISAERVVWPDGSLGCPEPGVVYTMAPVPGYRIRVRSPDALLDYHASNRGRLVLCPSAQSGGPPAAPTQ